MPSEPSIPGLERSRPLRLAFECLQTLPEGSNPVRVWWDENLQCEQVGKRVDLSNLDDVLPEPAILRQIRHDHVVPILAAPVVDGFPKPMRVIEIVTPYYERGSLTDAFLRGERFVPTEAVRIVQAALRGLGHLHEVHGILHRDIKSPNILLTGDEFLARVGDLGCAGRIGEDGRTPALDIPTLYSPPELVGTGVLTRASDLYPMGLVLLELLKGGFDYDAYPKTHVVRRLLRGVSPLSMAERSHPIWASRSLRRALTSPCILFRANAFRLRARWTTPYQGPVSSTGRRPTRFDGRRRSATIETAASELRPFGCARADSVYRRR